MRKISTNVKIVKLHISSRDEEFITIVRQANFKFYDFKERVLNENYVFFINKLITTHVVNYKLFNNL